MLDVFLCADSARGDVIGFAKRGAERYGGSLGDRNGLSTTVEPPAGFESSLWGVYLMAIHVLDQAQVNLGCSVSVEGPHHLDRAIRTLLRWLPSCRLTPLGAVVDRPLDVFIGCSLSALTTVLPAMRRSGTVISTCAPLDAQNLDVYSTIHQKGITVRSARLGAAFLSEAPNLNRRLRRLIVRSEYVSTRIRQHISTADSDMEYVHGRQGE